MHQRVHELSIVGDGVGAVLYRSQANQQVDMQKKPTDSQDFPQTAPQPSNVQRLVLPSILSAAVVFGLSLTVLGNHRTEWFERRAERSQTTPLDRSYVLTNQGRDNAIRVVGMAIVLSVATGIVTVELLRKRYAARVKEEGRIISEATVSLGVTAPIEKSIESNDGDTDLSRAIDEVWPHADLALANSDLTIWPTIQPAVHLLPGTYKTDRQVLPGTLHRQLVLNHDGQDYRFLRTAETPERLRLYCDLCERSNRAIVITQLGLEPESGFALWECVEGPVRSSPVRSGNEDEVPYLKDFATSPAIMDSRHQGIHHEDNGPRLGDTPA